MGSVFLSVNAGKRSLSLDLKSADAKGVVHRLVSQADVVVQNFKAGVIDRLGFDGDKVPRTYPTFGNTGPAAVPTVLSKEADAGRLTRGDRVILTGMGSGLNATAIEVVW